MRQAHLKRNTFRLYLNEADTRLMQECAQRTELGQSELMSKLMAAALRAVSENQFCFPLPLKFKIELDPPSFKRNRACYVPARE